MTWSLSDPLTIATFLVIVFTGFYLWCKYKQTYWSRRGVFSPPSNWFFGHFKDVITFKASPTVLLGDIHNTYRDEAIIGVYNFQKPMLLLRDPEVIKQILVKDFEIFPNRLFASSQTNDILSSANMFSIHNPQWKFMRSKMSAAFSTGKQKKLFEIMVDCSQNMNDFLDNAVVDGKLTTLEAREIATKYTTDVIGSLAFGTKTNSFEDSEFYRRGTTNQKLTIMNALRLFVTTFFPNKWFGGKFFGEEQDYFRKIFWESMNAREKSGTKRGDLIDFLLQVKNDKQSAEYNFEGDHLVAQSSIFFGAGLETSAITMSFTLWELAKNPELQRKVRQELREKMTGKRLTYEQMSELHYFNQVVSETLRVHPPAPWIERVSVKDYKLPGTDVVIEKGTTVYVTLNGLHMDPDHHPDPLKYDPDRFSEERKQDMKSCTYMPFGEGPRVCIGMRTGTLQTMVGLVTILSQYEISLNPEYKTEVSRRSIFTVPEKGIHLCFKKSPVYSN